jgi:hypothetical protein
VGGETASRARGDWLSQRRRRGTSGRAALEEEEVVGPHGRITDHVMGALFNSCIQLEITTN